MTQKERYRNGYVFNSLDVTYHKIIKAQTLITADALLT